MAGVYHMLCIIDVRKEPVDARFEFLLRIWKWSIEFIIEEHEIHDAVVRDYWLFQISYKIYHSGKTECIFCRDGLALYHLRCEKIQ